MVKKKNGKKSAVTLMLSAIMLLLVSVPAQAAFTYIHDPMLNPKAAADIIVNPDAVYGYSPNPESKRLGVFASYDWTDPEVVAKGRAEREAYHASSKELYDMISSMKAQGCSIEEIARAVSKRRNELRMEAYKDDPAGLEKLKQSNLETYGHEEGPTPDEMYEQKGSWEAVIQSALNSNPGMDACLGLYDEMYDTYLIEEPEPQAEEGKLPKASEDPAKSPKTGEPADPFVWIAVLAVVAASGVAAVTFRASKKTER